jgi:hypothetical protein
LPTWGKEGRANATLQEATFGLSGYTTQARSGTWSKYTIRSPPETANEQKTIGKGRKKATDYQGRGFSEVQSMMIDKPHLQRLL